MKRADDPACQLSPNEGDTDPAPGDESNTDGELPFEDRPGRPDCDPFIDASCDGGDPCDTGVAPGHPSHLDVARALLRVRMEYAGDLRLGDDFVRHAAQLRLAADQVVGWIRERL